MKNKHLIMPSHIVIKDGLACGDRIKIMYDISDNNMIFSIWSDGCNCCGQSCRYLQSRLSGASIKEILDECDRYEDIITNTPKLKKRFECYVAPLRIVRECANDTNVNSSGSNTTMNLYVDKMDCDACATRENVSWLYQKPRHIHGNYEISKHSRKVLMKLGEIACDFKDRDHIKNIVDNMGDSEFEFLEEYKLMPMVYQNLKKAKILDATDQRWRLLVYQRQRTVVAQPEISRINHFIDKEALKAYWIKGAFTRSFYEDKLMRNLTDYDLLVLDENDAFRIINNLLNNGFRVFPDSFSLKKSLRGTERVYTGHLHFQKIINLQYRMIVDVNFTGFPMIRVASYVPLVENGHIALESMIVVTLCHLFKHKEVFIKDINDLYVMLLSNKYNVEVLLNELRKNELEKLFSVVLKFIKSEYLTGLKMENNLFKLFENYKGLMDGINLGDWPYDISDVERIKAFCYEEFSKDKIDYQRLYLYPVIITKDIKDSNYIVKIFTQLFKFSETVKLTKNMYQIKINRYFFVVTPIGVFLEMKDYYEESMKESIREIIKQFIDYADFECLDIPYAIAFEENWLDNLG